MLRHHPSLFVDVGEMFKDVGEMFKDVGEMFIDVGEMFIDVQARRIRSFFWLIFARGE